MVHDSNKGKGPAVNKVGVAPVAATLADAAATQMGGKAEAVKNKAEQVSQGITQVSAVAEQFNGLGANGQSARARSTGIAGPLATPQQRKPLFQRDLADQVMRRLSALMKYSV